MCHILSVIPTVTYVITETGLWQMAQVEASLKICSTADTHGTLGPESGEVKDGRMEGLRMLVVVACSVDLSSRHTI